MLRDTQDPVGWALMHEGRLAPLRPRSPHRAQG